jgi:hypothetical protein
MTEYKYICPIDEDIYTYIPCKSCDNLLDKYELRDNEGYCNKCYK